jgi:hypothetical protein
MTGDDGQWPEFDIRPRFAEPLLRMSKSKGHRQELMRVELSI